LVSLPRHHRQRGRDRRRRCRHFSLPGRRRPERAITEEILGIGSLVGGAIALWGRIRASRKIG